MAKQITEQFSYRDVENKDVEGKLIRWAADAGRANMKEVESYIERGRIFAEAQSALAENGRNGLFSKWVESECNCSVRTAYNLISVFSVFGNCATVAQFRPNVLLGLSKKTTPGGAVKAAIKASKKGPVSEQMAKAFIEEFTVEEDEAEQEQEDVEQSPDPVVEDKPVVEEDQVVEPDPVIEPPQVTPDSPISQKLEELGHVKCSVCCGSGHVPPVGEIPDELKDPEFEAAVATFCQYRLKDKRKKVTPASWKLMLKDFTSWGASKSVEYIENAIKCGYQGVFASSKNGQAKERVIGNRLEDYE